MKLAVALFDLLGIAGVAGHLLNGLELLVDGGLEVGLPGEGEVDGRLPVVQLLLAVSVREWLKSRRRRLAVCFVTGSID